MKGAEPQVRAAAPLRVLRTVSTRGLHAALYAAGDAQRLAAIAAIAAAAHRALSRRAKRVAS